MRELSRSLADADCRPSARHCLHTLAALCGLAMPTPVGAALPPEAAEAVTSFTQLKAAAEAWAAQPWRPQPETPEFLKTITYDEFRHIGFDNSKAIWGETRLPFRLGFYHKGYVHHDDVTIHLLQEGRTRPLPFSKNYFHYLNFAKDFPIPDDLGFAGFRVQGCFPGKVDFEEIFTFVGASYFRARPGMGGLGTSARGLAVDVGLPKTEEFPVFREYWIQEPAPDDTSLHVLALLDSPSVTGAYHLLLTPGDESTDVDVQATLYFRQTPEKLGLAPLSSMWMWGDGLAGPKGDHRPEVHDADGLQIEGADGWTWRALGRQTYPSLVQFRVPGMKGFGLLQRDRDHAHYLDDEAHYHSRPSVWIEPKSDWGEGAVELLELPAPHEGIDNIAAWWTPDRKPEPGQPWDVAYRLSFFMGDRSNHGQARAVAYRVFRDNPNKLKLEVDFRGGDLPRDPQAIAPRVNVSAIRGVITANSCEQRMAGVWTAIIPFDPTGEGPIELRLSLVHPETQEPLSETWAYLCPLEPPPVSLPPWRLKEGEAEADSE